LLPDEKKKPPLREVTTGKDHQIELVG